MCCLYQCEQPDMPTASYIESRSNCKARRMCSIQVCMQIHPQANQEMNHPCPQLSNPMILLTGRRVITGFSSIMMFSFSAVSDASSSLSESRRGRPKRPNMLITRFEGDLDCLKDGGARRVWAHSDNALTTSLSSSISNRSRIYRRTGSRYRCVEMVFRAL